MAWVNSSLEVVILLSPPCVLVPVSPSVSQDGLVQMGESSAETSWFSAGLESWASSSRCLVDARASTKV